MDGLNQAWFIYIELAFSGELNSGKPIKMLNQLVSHILQDAGLSQCSNISQRTAQG